MGADESRVGQQMVQSALIPDRPDSPPVPPPPASGARRKEIRMDIDEARVRRYVTALRNAPCIHMYADCLTCEARAVIAVADEEQADLRAELADAREWLGAMEALTARHAISAHARGAFEEERRWLDLKIMLERTAPKEGTKVPEGDCDGR